jgi:hypothetical protein
MFFVGQFYESPVFIAHQCLAYFKKPKTFKQRGNCFEHRKKFFHTADGVWDTEKCFSTLPTAFWTQKKVFLPSRRCFEHRKIFFCPPDSVLNTEKSFSAFLTVF